MVCIIDDREDVWTYSPNLIHVRPYHYFKNTGDINAPFPKNIPTVPSKPIPEKVDDKPTLVPSEAVKHQYENRLADQSSEEDADDYLLYLKSILISIHTAYYQVLKTFRNNTIENEKN